MIACRLARAGAAQRGVVWSRRPWALSGRWLAGVSSGSDGSGEAPEDDDAGDAEATEAEDLARVQRVHEGLGSLLGAVDDHVVGHTELKEAMLLGIVAKEHVYLEGPPGSAKTYLSEIISESTDLGFFFYQMHRDSRLSELIGDAVIVRDTGPDGAETIRQVGFFFCCVVQMATWSLEINAPMLWQASMAGGANNKTNPFRPFPSLSVPFPPVSVPFRPLPSPSLPFPPPVDGAGGLAHCRDLRFGRHLAGAGGGAERAAADFERAAVRP